jgi:pSer/pThr/pTyr-binding forkhead associated (FHA) protein
MPKIQITLPDGREDTHDLLDETITVGRQSENSIIIEDVSVSGRHAKFTRVGSDEYRLEDLGSTNGTRLNGEPLKEARALDDGDQVRFGKVEAVYHSSARKGARPMPEAEKAEARLGESSRKPQGFGNVSPFKKRQRARDPLAQGLIGFGLFAIGAFLFAVLRTLLLQPPQ